jgi:transposase-like protein
VDNFRKGSRLKNKQRLHDNAFKARVALEAIKGEKTLAEIASFYKVHTTQISRWRKKALEGLKEIFADSKDNGARESEELQEELYKEIGRLKVELDWLKKKSAQFC